jgi:hypothetical protein
LGKRLGPGLLWPFLIGDFWFRSEGIDSERAFGTKPVPPEKAREGEHRSFADRFGPKREAICSPSGAGNRRGWRRQRPCDCRQPSDMRSVALGSLARAALGGQRRHFLTSWAVLVLDRGSETGVKEFFNTLRSPYSISYVVTALPFRWNEEGDSMVAQDGVVESSAIGR